MLPSAKTQTNRKNKITYSDRRELEKKQVYYQYKTGTLPAPCPHCRRRPQGGGSFRALFQHVFAQQTCKKLLGGHEGAHGRRESHRYIGLKLFWVL